MEYTIDNIISILEKSKKNILDSKEQSFDACDMAIDILKRYQTIENVYRDWCMPTKISTIDAMEKIGSIIKYGPNKKNIRSYWTRIIDNDFLREYGGIQYECSRCGFVYVAEQGHSPVRDGMICCPSCMARNEIEI